MTKTPHARSMQLETWFREYETDHTDAKNKLTHVVGIPLIVMGLLALLRKLQLGPTNFALILMVGLAVFLFKHDRKLVAPFVGLLFGFYVISFLVSTKLAWILFVMGGGLQLLGHYKFERREPTLLKNVIHLLVGPVWIVARLTGLR